jgi:glycosyltransferase involved in cell wall biosynthesis
LAVLAFRDLICVNVRRDFPDRHAVFTVRRQRGAIVPDWSVPLPVQNKSGPAAVSAGPAYSLIIPVFRNADSLPDLLKQVDRIATNLPEPLETVFVIDGSPDASYAILKHALAARPSPAQLIALSRNFGSFSAIRTGMAKARGRYFAVMAADLQEPPELIDELFRALNEEEIDVVIATRLYRGDPFLSRLFSSAFWFIYRKLVLPEMPPGGADLFACSKRVRDVLCSLAELRTSLVGLIFWVGFRRKFVPYRRLPRRHGRSAWGFRRKLHYMLDSIYSFTSLPIELLTVTGAIGIAASLGISSVVLGAWLMGLINVPGYAPVILSIVFFGALNLFGSGIVGSYVFRTYENTKGRPYAIILSEEVFGGPR